LKVCIQLTLNLTTLNIFQIIGLGNGFHCHKPKLLHTTLKFKFGRETVQAKAEEADQPSSVGMFFNVSVNQLFASDFYYFILFLQQ